MVSKRIPDGYQTRVWQNKPFIFSGDKGVICAVHKGIIPPDPSETASNSLIETSLQFIWWNYTHRTERPPESRIGWNKPPIYQPRETQLWRESQKPRPRTTTQKPEKTILIRQNKNCTEYRTTLEQFTEPLRNVVFTRVFGFLSFCKPPRTTQENSSKTEFELLCTTFCIFIHNILHFIHLLCEVMRSYEM